MIRRLGRAIEPRAPSRVRSGVNGRLTARYGSPAPSGSETDEDRQACPLRGSGNRSIAAAGMPGPASPGTHPGIIASDVVNQRLHQARPTAVDADSRSTEDRIRPAHRHGALRN